MKSQTLLVCAAVTLLAAAPAAAKPYLYMITSVPNSMLTTIFDINDHGVATGSWYEANGIEHGYFGPPNGSNYQEFDDQTDPGTEPRGIDNGGDIVGFDNSQSGSNESYIPFERTADGTITNVTKAGAPLNSLAQGINRKGVFAGSYVNTNLQFVGYLGRSGKYTGAIKLKGLKTAGIAGRGIDGAGDIVGWYYDTGGVQHGFYLPHGGSPQTVDYGEKKAVSTVLEGLNDEGVATGQYTDTLGNIHGFTYDVSTKTFHGIRVPGAATFVQPWGINDKGWIALGSDVGYFVYCPSLKNCVGEPAAYRPPMQKLHPLAP
ncbi:MAG: hypothetical protein ACREHF_09060 [Rhizomicrobium sp.]